MNIKKIKQDGLTHEMEITIPASNIDQRIDARLLEVGKTIRLSGFRPGKAPMAMLKKKYGRAVMGEVLEQAVNETSAKALEQNNLRPAMQPKIEVKEFDEGKDLKYAMTVEVLPEITLADFKKAKLEKLVAEPSGKEIDEALEKLAEMRQTTAPITGKRGAKEGDTVVIEFDGRTADDNKKHDGMHAAGHHLKLGSGQFIPGFEDQLIGAKAGEKTEVKVSFPENYGAKELAGRDAIFDVTIEEIREPSTTEINDEFAKSFGLEDVAALKNAVKEQLQMEFDNNARMVLKRRLLDYLDEAHKIDVPPTMLDLEQKNIFDQLEIERQRVGEKGELSAADKKEYAEIAGRRVRLGLVLSEIGHKNKIVVSDIELQKAVIAEAQKYPGQERDVFDYYAKNPHALQSMRAPLFEDKVVDYILALAEINEKKVSAKELMVELEGDEDEAAEAKPKKKSDSATKKEGGESKPAAKKTTAKKKHA